MTEAFHTLRRAVIDRVERRELPVDDVEAIRAEVERVVADYERLARLGDALPLADPTATIQQVVHSIADLGPLTDVLARDDVEEVFIEGARVVYLDSTGRLRGLSIPTSEEENRHVVERLLATTDRVLNARHPIVSARVLGGAARLTAAIPPISDVLSATIRRYVVRDVTLDDLVGRETLDREAAEFLKLVMRMRSRVAVSGEPGAGKTTMLAALLHAAPAGQCIRCCEEIRELAVPLVHGGYYEVRPSGIDGTGEITLRDLVKFVLSNPRLRYHEGREGQDAGRRGVPADLLGPGRHDARRRPPGRGLRSALRTARVAHRRDVHRQRHERLQATRPPRLSAAS